MATVATAEVRRIVKVSVIGTESPVTGTSYASAGTPSNTHEGEIMKTVLLTAAAALTFIAGVAVADAVRDWHDLDKVHDHVVEAIHELDRARAANHYDMAGHGAKAEQLLHEAEHELHEAVESSKAAH
jgi:hypothetical protein